MSSSESTAAVPAHSSPEATSVSTHQCPMRRVIRSSRCPRTSTARNTANRPHSTSKGASGRPLRNSLPTNARQTAATTATHPATIGPARKRRFFPASGGRGTGAPGASGTASGPIGAVPGAAGPASGAAGAPPVPSGACDSTCPQCGQTLPSGTDPPQRKHIMFPTPRHSFRRVCHKAANPPFPCGRPDGFPRSR